MTLLKGNTGLIGLVTMAAVGMATAEEKDSAPVNSAIRGQVVSGRFNLEYRIEGQGNPAVVVGFPNYYSRVFSRALRSKLQLVFVDHRGSARSPGPTDTSEFSIEKLVDDIELMRRSLGLGPIIVIGHSGHSYLAIEYAKKYPESVSHVVMICIAPDLSATSTNIALQEWDMRASAERKAALQASYQRVPLDQLLQLAPRDRFVADYVREGPRMWFDYNFDATPLWNGVDINTDMMSHVWGKLFRDIDITEGLHDLKRPVLVALGRYDFSVAPAHSWDSVRDQFHDLTIRVFERSGHTVPLEQPEQFDRVLLDWISRKP